MKKTVSLLLTALLAFSLMLPAAATTIVAPIALPVGESGYTYTLTQTEYGSVLSDVRYVGDEEAADKKIAFVPKTLGGVALTNDALTGEAFYFGEVYVQGFRVEEDNPFFCVKDNLLFTKDAKKLVYYPDRRINGICRVPDGTEALGSHCFDVYESSDNSGQNVCIVIPDSVTAIADDAFGAGTPALAGSADSAAARYAEEKGLVFVALGENHKHAYFRVKTEPTCTAGGEIRVSCPCGDTKYSELLKALGHQWSQRNVEGEDGVVRHETYCTVCGEVKSSFVTEASVAEGCSCLCHKINRTWSFSLTKDNWQQVFRNVVFRFKLAFWHLTGQHQFCECGVRHF